MASLSAYFEENKNKIQHLIDTKNTTEDFPRPYLGMSQIGDSCMRKLWFYFRWVEKSIIDGRVNRIFQTGHESELKMVRDLESIGVETWATLDSQAEFVAVNGHFRGHSDGLARLIPGAEKTTHLLEFKTSSDKYFKIMVKKGVKEAKPTHHAQMVIYAYFSKVTRMLYVVYNKNNSAYYMERLHADGDYARDLIRKAEQVITCEDFNEFSKIGSGNASYYECKFCDFSDVCHNGKTPVKSCRTCTSANIIDDGKWECNLMKMEISTSQQKITCRNYQILECFED